MFMELVYWLRGEISSGEGLFAGLILRYGEPNQGWVQGDEGWELNSNSRKLIWRRG
jgi:hypothetical protein